MPCRQDGAAICTQPVLASGLLCACNAVFLVCRAIPLRSTHWPLPASKPPSCPELLASSASPATAAEGEEGAPAWEQLASLPFVDQARSSPLFRAFYVPGLSAQRNRRYEYVLLRRKDNSGMQHAEGQDVKQPQ